MRTTNAILFSCIGSGECKDSYLKAWTNKPNYIGWLDTTRGMYCLFVVSFGKHFKCSTFTSICVAFTCIGLPLRHTVEVSLCEIFYSSCVFVILGSKGVLRDLTSAMLCDLLTVLNDWKPLCWLWECYEAGFVALYRGF